MAESIPNLEAYQTLETGFAERAGEIFRTVINLETKVNLLELVKVDADYLNGLGEDELVQVESTFVKGLSGSILFLLSKILTAKVVDFMIMGDGEVEFMPDEHLDGIVEAINQLMGAEMTDMSLRLGLSLRNEVQAARLMTMAELAAEYADWVLVRFEVIIEGQAPATLLKAYSPEAFESLGKVLLHGADGASASEPQEDAPREIEIPMPDTIPDEEPQREVKRAEFTDFGSAPQPASNAFDGTMTHSLGKVLDLDLPVTIELGRTRMLIKDIVELNPGSIVELNKLVGEPVDLFVNGKKFALGEVVVIDENFGVRITDLVKMEERMRQATQ